MKSQRDEVLLANWAKSGYHVRCQMFVVNSEHVLACMVKVYMSYVVSTPQTPDLGSSDQVATAVQDSTARILRHLYSAPTRVPDRDLRWPVSLVYDEHDGNLFWVDVAVK